MKQAGIQIQPMLRLNAYFCQYINCKSIIQIQPMLRLNKNGLQKCICAGKIQIQPMLRLNPCASACAYKTSSDSNTTNVKVKSAALFKTLTQH